VDYDKSRLDHVVSELIDVLFTVAPISSLDERVSLAVKSSPRWSELEGPIDDSCKLNCYHKKLLASLKCGPQLEISWTRSSMQIMPNLPKLFSITSFEWIGILAPSTLAYPRL